MQKKLLKRKILLALCLGSMVTIQPAYAATPEVGYSVPGDNVTLNTSDISITKEVDDSIFVIGVSNYGRSKFLLSNPLTTITAGAKSSSSSRYTPAEACGINNYGDMFGHSATTSISGDAVISVTATGGNAYSEETGLDGDAYANANAEGIHNYSDGASAITSISGDAAITVTATGGSAKHTSTSTYAVANANTTGYGIFNYNYGDGATTNINGDATIKVTATGGSATATAAYAQESAEAEAEAKGLYNHGTGATTNISGDAVITVTATGGSATSSSAYGAASAYGYAYGIDNAGIGATANISGDATIIVTATGGSATSLPASAEAWGISNSGDSATTNLSGDAAITVNATGGSATSTLASANAWGVSNSGTDATTSISGDAAITATATGGKATVASAFGYAYANAFASAKGIDTGSGATTSIKGNAAITVTATGGSATSTALYAEADASAYAYGISNSGSTSMSGDAAITVTATGGAPTSTSGDAYADAYAYGIYSSGSGTVSLEKNTTITATATTNNGEAYAYSLYADGGTININQTARNPYTVKLTGDVLATGGSINLNLNNSSSFLRGNVIANGGAINLTLGNQAVWQPVYDNRNGTITYATTKSLSGYSAAENTISALDLSGGIIDLTWDDNQRTSYRKFNITTLNGNGGTLKLNTNVANSTGDIATVGTLSSAATLKVAVTYDRSLSTITQPTTIYASGYIPVSVTTGASNLTLAGVTTDSGAFSLTPSFSGTSLTSLTVGASSNTKAAASSASSQANMLQTSVNHLRKRLGDLRDGPAAESGIWARIYSGEVSNDKYTSIESAYKGTQIGYDKSREVKDGRTYTGGAVSYTEADNSFSRGGGESKDCDLALYQTWIGNDGHYYDLIAKHGRLSSDYHVTDISNNYSTADYHTQASSLSAEYGYRKQLKDGWYLEPQVELTYGHINGVNYTTSSGMNVKQDGIDRLIGRMGIGLGKKLTTGANLYTSLSVLHEFNGEENVKADTLTYSQDMSGTWYEFILGASGKLSKHSTGYVNVEKLFGGDVSSDWQFNAGCRWSF